MIDMIRRALTGFAATLVLVVAATLTSTTDAYGQAKASLTATARVVDAGPGWAAHVGAQAGVEQAMASGQFVGGEVKMTESALVSESLPRPVVVVARTGPDSPRAVTIYVQHVAN